MWHKTGMVVIVGSAWIMVGAEIGSAAIKLSPWFVVFFVPWLGIGAVFLGALRDGR